MALELGVVQLHDNGEACQPRRQSHPYRRHRHNNDDVRLLAPGYVSDLIRRHPGTPDGVAAFVVSEHTAAQHLPLQRASPTEEPSAHKAGKDRNIMPAFQEPMTQVVSGRLHTTQILWQVTVFGYEKYPHLRRPDSCFRLTGQGEVEDSLPSISG